MLITKTSSIFRLITLVFLTTITIEIGLQIRRVLPQSTVKKSKDNKDILIIGDSVSSKYPQYLRQELPSYNIETLIAPNASISEMKVKFNQLKQNYFLSIILLGRFEKDNKSYKVSKNSDFLILPRYLNKGFNQLNDNLTDSLNMLNGSENLLGEIEKLISSHQYKKAIPLLKNYLKSTTDLDAYATLAFCLIKSSKFDQASLWIKKGLSLDPGHILLKIRNLELLQGQNANYQDLMLSLLKEKPKYHDFYYILIQELHKNSDSQIKAQIKKALEQFILTIKKELKNIQSLEFYLNYLLYRKDFEEFKITLDGLSSHQVLNTRVIELITKYYISLSNFEHALNEIDKLKEKKIPNHLLEALLGDVHYSKNNFLQAEKHYKRSLDQKLSLPVTKSYAITLKINQNFDRSLRQFEKLIEIQPENQDFHLRYGECIYESKKFEHGINFYQDKFQNKNSTYKHLALANFYIGLKNQAKSLENIKISIQEQAASEILSKTVKRYQNTFNTIIDTQIPPMHEHKIEADRYNALITLIKQKSKHVIILGYPDSNLDLGERLGLNQSENIIFVSTYEMIEKNNDKNLLSWDNLHFSPKGNQVLANYLKNIIASFKN